MATSLTIFKISELKFDLESYPRENGYSWVKAHEYADHMKAGFDLGPIVVGKYNGELYVVDGWHRCKALKELGEEFVKGIEKTYSSLDKLLADSAEYNSKHGFALTQKDKVRIIDKLQDFGYTQIEIGKIIKATPEMVKTLAKRIIRAPNGTRIYLQSSIAKLLEKGYITEEDCYDFDQSRFSTRTIKDLMVQVITLLQNHAYPWGDPSLKQMAIEAYQMFGQNITIDDMK